MTDIPNGGSGSVLVTRNGSSAIVNGWFIYYPNASTLIDESGLGNEGLEGWKVTGTAANNAYVVVYPTTYADGATVSTSYLVTVTDGLGHAFSGTFAITGVPPASPTPGVGAC